MKKCCFLAWLLVIAVVARAETGFLKNLPPEEFNRAGLKKLTPEELARLELLFQQFKTGELTAMQQQAAALTQASQEEAQKKVLAAEQATREAEQKAKAAEAKAREAEAQAVAAREAETQATQARLAEAKAAEAREAEAKAGAVREAEAKTAASSEMKATQQAAAKPAPAKKEPTWYAALLTLKHTSEKPAKAEPLLDRLAGDFSGWDVRTIFTLENGSRWVIQNRNETYLYSPVLHSPKVKIVPASLSGFWLDIEGVNRSVRVIPFELRDRR